MAGVNLGAFNEGSFKQQQRVAVAQPAKKGGSSNLLSRIANSFIDPAVNVGTNVSNVIGNAEVRAAHAVGLGKNARTMSNTEQYGSTFGNHAQNNSPKQFAGNVAQLGAMVVAPEAKAGLLAKTVQGAKVGAVAGAGSAAASDQNIVKGAVTGGAGGAVAGGLLSKFSRNAPATTTTDAEKVIASKQANGLKSPLASTGAKTQKYGTDLLANKLNISAKDAEKFNGPDTIHRLNANYGLTPHQGAQLHPVVTGGDGVATTAMDGALENVGKLKFSDFSDSLKQELQDPEFLTANDMSASQAKNMASLIDKYHSALNPAGDKALTKANAAGATIEGGTNAKAAMDIARKLEGSGYKNQAASSEAKNATGDMQLKMADFIKSRIYNSPGGQDALDVAKHETASNLDAVAHQSGNTKLHTVADAFRNAPDWQSFRNVSAPFVNAKQLVDKTNLNDFANAGGDSASRGLFNTLYAGASKVISPVGGKVLSKVGDKLTNATERTAGASEQVAAKGPGTMLDRFVANPRTARVAEAATGATLGNPPEADTSQPPQQDANAVDLSGGQEDATNPQDVLGFASPQDALGMNGAADASATSADGSGQVYTQEQLINDINGDPKHASNFISLYNALKPPADSSSTGGKVSAQQKGLASTGLSSLQQLATEINQNPNVVTKSATPGQSIPIFGGYITNKAGVGDYEANANQVLDALARLRTGAAMSKNEERFYRNLLPKAGDSTDTIQTKLVNLQQAFGQFAQ